MSYMKRYILVISSQILSIRIIEKYCKIPNHSYFAPDSSCLFVMFLSVNMRGLLERNCKLSLRALQAHIFHGSVKFVPTFCPARWKSLTIYSSQLLPQSCYSHKLTTELIFGESCSERPRSAAFISTAFSPFSN